MAPSSAIHIGMVGLSHMSDLFAEKLLADGYTLTGSTRTRTHPGVSRQERAANRLGDLVSCGVVLTSPPDDPILRSVHWIRADWLW